MDNVNFEGCLEDVFVCVEQIINKEVIKLTEENILLKYFCCVQYDAGFFKCVRQRDNRRRHIQAPV